MNGDFPLLNNPVLLPVCKAKGGSGVFPYTVLMDSGTKKKNT
jgi:hypothetical protein